MDVFAERARRELLATGEIVRKRTVGAPDAAVSLRWKYGDKSSKAQPFAPWSPQLS
ncbi:hypothetical protein [Catenulispora sp. EB89]|uniref:hypothetical protein n=1 Tax=Catenulispora sp. EB89 TaxID=3156257 RepID=UPI0035110DEB